jgi:carbon storage regulator
MLVLSRKPGEGVAIGDTIRLTVLAICGNRVRFGLTAPPDVSIQREELCQKAEGPETWAIRPPTWEAEP